MFKYRGEKYIDQSQVPESVVQEQESLEGPQGQMIQDSNGNKPAFCQLLPLFWAQVFTNSKAKFITKKTC